VKRTRQAHGLAFSSLLMIVGLFSFGLRTPGAAPKRLYAHAYSPEDIRAEFAREQKLLGRGGCQIEAKMKRDDRVL
jgi:hypothetical protein